MKSRDWLACGVNLGYRQCVCGRCARGLLIAWLKPFSWFLGRNEWSGLKGSWCKERRASFLRASSHPAHGLMDSFLQSLIGEWVSKEWRMTSGFAIFLLLTMDWALFQAKKLVIRGSLCQGQKYTTTWDSSGKFRKVLAAFIGFYLTSYLASRLI